MSATFDTSHFEMSPLNLLADKKILFILVIVDTSQDPIGPCGVCERSLEDSLRHVSTALLSSCFDRGENAVGALMA